MEQSQSMFYGAKPSIFEKARMLRQNMTEHELMLWEELRANKISGLRFKAQHPVDTFVVDFYCHKVGLVIEVDGENHSSKLQSDYDNGRTDELEKLGLAVVRFKNFDVEENLINTVKSISETCDKLLHQKR